LVDRFSPEKRSWIMSRIRSKRTSPEMTIHNWLCGMKIRHEMYPKVLGNPDIKICHGGMEIYLFVDGCFWHGCPLHYKRPKSNIGYWVRHIEVENVERDKKRAELPYRWVRIWEHEVRDGSFKGKILSVLGGGWR